MSKQKVALALLVLLAAGCSGGGSNRHHGNDGGSSFDLAGSDSALPGEWTETPYLATTATHSFSQAESVTTSGVDYAARIVTDAGTIVVDLNEVETPITVNSFVFLARHHFFEGIAFHRVIEDFMAQSGDPNTIEGPTSQWGFGGPGYEFADEIVSTLNFSARGVLAMANSGPDTNGSQFFITFAEASFLDGGYTIFGHVIEGDAVLDVIVRGEPPTVPTRISSVQILER